jgi:energy-coupling factor transporter ATP-binding protein EcfA2
LPARAVLVLNVAMLPLESLTIKRFRGLVDVELPALGRFNVLVGRNNSGKTTILEAIATHACPLRPSEWMEAVHRRDGASSRTALIEGLRWLFPPPGRVLPDGSFKGTTLRTTITSDGRVHLSIAELRELEGFIEETEDGEQVVHLAHEGGLRRGVELTLTASMGAGEQQGEPVSTRFWEGLRGPIVQNAFEPLLPVSTITPFSHRTQREVEVLSNALFADLKPTVLDLVRIFDPEIEDFEILKRPRSEPAVYMRHARLGKAPLSIFGDGMRRVLLIGVSLAMVKGGILLVDEIESAIHVEALDASFRWLQRACRELDVQLFATTHSLEAVDALIAAADGADDLVAYRLEQKDGKVRAKRFSSESLRVLREELGQEIRT